VAAYRLGLNKGQVHRGFGVQGWNAKRLTPGPPLFLTPTGFVNHPDAFLFGSTAKPRGSGVLPNLANGHLVDVPQQAMNNRLLADGLSIGRAPQQAKQ
jgi:hypothetical protein